MIDGDHRGRRALAQALRVGLHAQAEVAADQRDQDAEHHRLRHGQHQVGQAHRGRQRAAEEGGLMPSDRSAATMPPSRPATRGPAADQGHGDGQRHGARHHQPVAVRDAHHAHRVEFLGHAHHADLRGDGRAGAAGDQDGAPASGPSSRTRAMPRMSTMYASAPNCLQLLRGEVGQHHADQAADQRGDRQARSRRCGTGGRRSRATAPGAAPRSSWPRSSVSWPIRRTKLRRWPSARSSAPPKPRYSAHKPPRGAPPRRAGELRHPLEHGALRRQQFHAARASAGPSGPTAAARRRGPAARPRAGPSPGCAVGRGRPRSRSRNTAAAARTGPPSIRRAGGRRGLAARAPVRMRGVASVMAWGWRASIVMAEPAAAV